MNIVAAKAQRFSPQSHLNLNSTAVSTCYIVNAEGCEQVVTEQMIRECCVKLLQQCHS